MPLRSILPYFALTVILRSSTLCDGLSDAAEETPAIQGNHRLIRIKSGLKPEAAASTRPGSLTFTGEQNGYFNSSKGLLSAKLQRLAPSVHCDHKQMTLSVKRRGTHHFLIDSGEEPLTPLSQMPSTCGFFVKRSRRDVQYGASYQGCHVKKQDDEYSLPLRLWGTPMTMSCPDMLPLPSILCFPNKMVVKIRGVSAKELKVKVSGSWQPLSSTCSSCGLTFSESSGEMTLMVPYNKNLCLEIKDEEYLLSLQWADFDLSASCPVEPNADLAVAAHSSDYDKALYPQLPMFSQFLEPQSTQTPGHVAPLPFSFVAADLPEKQKMPENMDPTLLPGLFWLPRRESPMDASGENSHTNQPQLLQTLLSGRYQIPFFQELPVMPGGFSQTATSPLPATSTKTVVTTLSPTGNEKVQLPPQPELPVMLQYPFPGYPAPPEDRTVDDAESETQLPQVFQIPMLYPPFNQLSQLLNTPIATTETPPFVKPLFQPHPYVPIHVPPKLAPIPVFLHPPFMTPSNPAPSGKQEQQPFYFAMQPVYRFSPDQSQTTSANI